MPVDLRAELQAIRADLARHVEGCRGRDFCTGRLCRLCLQQPPAHSETCPVSRLSALLVDAEAPTTDLPSLIETVCKAEGWVLMPRAEVEALKAALKQIIELEAPGDALDGLHALDVAETAARFAASALALLDRGGEGASS